MIYPSMASLLKKVDSRYTLVIAASRRARMLTEGAQKLTDHESPRDVTIAIHEISEGKVTYHRVGKSSVDEEPNFVTESVTKSKPQWESKRIVDEEEEEEFVDDDQDSDEDILDSDDEDKDDDKDDDEDEDN